jgi:hypothetical protein
LSELAPNVGFIVNAARWASPELLKEMVEAALDEAERQATGKKESVNLEEMRAMWRSWIPDFRILCLCASHERMSMWYHYADKYRGAVIEFECSDERDSPWLAAAPMQYPVQAPEIFSAIGWGRQTSLRPEIAVRRLLDAYTFNKTPEWSYEEEWRITTFKRPEDTGNFTDWPVHPKDFAKVYLGPFISDADRLEILGLLQNDLSHVVPLQARFEAARRFSFHELAFQ